VGLARLVQERDRALLRITSAGRKAVERRDE
jgi:hypothetical protein